MHVLSSHIKKKTELVSLKSLGINVSSLLARRICFAANLKVMLDISANLNEDSVK